jgi:hypothetical protein
MKTFNIAVIHTTSGEQSTNSFTVQRFPDGEVVGPK